MTHEDMHGQRADLGTGQTGKSYITAEKGEYDMYRAQPEEKAAFEAGFHGAGKAISNLVHNGTYEPEMQAYVDYANSNSYSQAITNLQMQQNDPNVESTLQQVISDKENGIARGDPSASYQAIYQAAGQETAKVTSGPGAGGSSPNGIKTWPAAGPGSGSAPDNSGGQGTLAGMEPSIE